jgi:outer membrane protein assembly factor BamB
VGRYGPQGGGPQATGNLVLVPGGFDGGDVVAYDAATGVERWRYTGTSSAFIRSVGPDSVVVAPQYGSLTVLDLASGRERWHLTLPGDASASVATISDGRIFAGVSYPAAGSTSPPAVYALDFASGRVQWASVLDEEIELQWAPPVVAGDVVLVAGPPRSGAKVPTSYLYALDAGSGEIRWKGDLDSDGPGFHDQPPVVGGGLVYAKNTGGPPGQPRPLGVFAFDLRSGKEVWRRESRGPVLIAGVAHGLLLTVLGEDAVGLDARTGEERWRVPGGRGGPSSRAIRQGDVLYVLTESSTLAVDLPSGGLRWRMEIGCQQIPVLADGVLYVPGGRLVALDAGSGTPLWKADVPAQRGGTAQASTAHVVITTADGSLVAVPRGR